MAEKEMSFLQHLEELRWHLIRAFSVTLILGLLVFFYKDFFLEKVLFGPSHSDFITYRLLCNLSKSVADSDALCVGDIPLQIINRKIAGQFYAYAWAYLITGVVLGFPYFVYEMWRFMAPGLTKKERRYGSLFIFLASVFFTLGLMFGYFIITPLTIRFFTGISISSELANQPDLSDYISTLAVTNLSTAIIFELPVAVLIMVKAGLIDSKFLTTYRKHAIVIILFLSAIITPPDFLSQVLVALPIMLLYEFSIFIARLTEKDNKKNELSKTV